MAQSTSNRQTNPFPGKNARKIRQPTRPAR